VTVRQESFVFEVTARCQHDCAHCYNVWKGATPYPTGELGTADLLALLDRALDQIGARLVTLSGGEPLLRPDLPQIVEHAVARGVRVNLITNATLLDERMIDRLSPGKVSVFELPLLSADRGIHDALSGAPGAFDRVTAAMAELKLRNERVVGVFVATRRNLPGLREALELAVALGIDGVMLNRFNPGGRGRLHIAELQASPAELRTALDVAQAASVELELPISCSIPMPPCLFDHSRWPRLGFGFCAAGTTRAYYTLDPVGNLRPCNHSPTILGNLRERSFADLVASPALTRFCAARPRFCAGCRLEDTCLGGCRAAAEACNGAIDAMDPFLQAFQAEARKPPPGT
jgi:radical SAM protein with 4Fe4S-binding SPASM domain